MEISLALVFTLIAIVGWGFGDFFIQRAVRKMGDWEVLFIITAFGAAVLSPFVIDELPALFSFTDSTFLILLGASLILFIAALLDFEALKKGKLAVVEPIWSLEIIASTTLAFFFIGERITFFQLFLILALIVGLVLVSLRSYHFTKRIWLEKGVFLAVLSALIMGMANFFIGFGSRASDGIVMNWFLNMVMALGCIVYLLYTKSFKGMMQRIRSSRKPLLYMCLFDNAAWIGFAVAMTMAPIGITVALSESYIVIAVLLGMIVNKEKLHTHQKAGMILAILAAILLAYATYA